MPDSKKNDLKAFIEAHLDDDPARLALQMKDIPAHQRSFLVVQPGLHKKALKKLPVFASHYCCYTAKSLEQSSSGPLALYKASLVPKGKTMLDISGGLGADDWAFSQRFGQVISLDTDRELNEIARDNFEKLGVENITRLDENAHHFISDYRSFDFIYADADRRPGDDGKRVLSLEDGQPDILAIKTRLLELSSLIMIKLSPMLDISEVIKKLAHVREIYVVSHDNEVKELLVMMTPDAVKGIRIHAVDLGDKGVRHLYSGDFPASVKPTLNHEGDYFYEPGYALIKSGLAPSYAEAHGLTMLSAHSYYFLSDTYRDGFFGRSFRVLHRSVFSRQGVSAYLSGAGIEQANVARRNFPMETDAIKKMFRVKDGGEEYLFFTQDASGQKLFFHCRKTT